MISKLFAMGLKRAANGRFACAVMCLTSFCGAAAIEAHAEEASTTRSDLMLRDFYAHDPMYFLFSPADGVAKFQLSFRYRIAGQEDLQNEGARRWYEHFFFAYSQTSFWDLSAPSKPFRDTSYRPAFMYQFERPSSSWLPGNDDSSYLRVAFQHESNGKDGPQSRSYNIVYVEPNFGFRLQDGWDFVVRPRAWGYVLDLSDNPDMARYRGNVSLLVGLTQDHGYGFVVSGRGNPGTGKGSVTADVTYDVLQDFRIHPYLDLQLFTGYGDSLLTYNTRETRVRLGIAFVR